MSCNKARCHVGQKIGYGDVEEWSPLSPYLTALDSFLKPKGRSTKRSKMLAENSKKRWQKSSKTVDEKTVIEIIHVSVSYDGTSQKRGHTSNLGLGIIIDILSGLVFDFEVLSKYCQNCVVAGRDMGVDSEEFHIWQKGHADECDKNFDGTSGAMEMHAALIMWRRSIRDCQMRFVSMLSDGDLKTFSIFVGH
ncbi:uncharacterized protein TNCV_4211921 [Trichonephila clavipes]|nr:uncharacterized protein TNCV_4211921 [Trichonephila clavipes]